MLKVQDKILEKIQGVSLYVYSFRNFPVALLKRVLQLYPISVNLRKQNLVVEVENRDQFYMAGYLGSFDPYTGDGMSIKFLETEKAFSISRKTGRTITVKHVFDDGDFPGIFYAEEYKGIDVEGRTVIDVGCSIGESSLYFYLFGAKKIYAYEPTKYAYNYAYENVNVNKLDDVVIVRNAAVGVHSGKIFIDGTRRITGGSALKYDSNGIEVDVVSFGGIIKQAGDKDMILKMDCEGCEYEIFNSILPNDLRVFLHMILEYHDGPNAILEILAKAGFRTELKTKEGRVGIIIANRCD